jgi:antitoxin component HigA of HigAB toxin-antitoxin module
MSFFDSNSYFIDEKVNFLKFENSYKVFNDKGDEIGSVRQRLTAGQKLLRLLVNKALLPFSLEIRDLDEKLQKDPELRKHHQQEKLILDVTELIARLMERNKVNKTQLANLLGLGKSHITQLLDGTKNMTLRTIADVFTALDSELAIDAGSLSLGLDQTYKYDEYEAGCSIQARVDTIPEELLQTNWVPKDNRKLMVA